MKRLLILILLHIGCRGYAQTAIDSTAYVHIGGIEQFISIKGSDNTKPLLLFLHGGPGGSVMDYAEKFTTKLQQHFVVVHWDQRETGKTFIKNTSPVPLTINLFESDTHELVNYLLKRFHQQKIFLVGHSWGTFLGFQMVKQHPQLLSAFVAVGPMVNQTESEKVILNMMKEKAKKDNNKRALDELNSIQIPFKNGDQLYYQRKWLFQYVGSKTRITKEYVNNWASRWLSVYNEACKENLFETLPKVACPVYFFVGRKDYQTNSHIAERYFKTVAAPKKQLFWFERSAHAIPTTEPLLFQQIIVDKILRDIPPEK